MVIFILNNVYNNAKDAKLIIWLSGEHLPRNAEVVVSNPGTGT